uniref:Transmembrane protein n=1 Tax=Macrostomum lignano TaxID=282301 RepID=A0A1I8J676_9PLAT
MGHAQTESREATMLEDEDVVSKASQTTSWRTLLGVFCAAAVVGFCATSAILMLMSRTRGAAGVAN